MVQYVADYDERFLMYQGNSDDAGRTHYHVLLLPYVKNQQVFRYSSYRKPMNYGNNKGAEFSSRLHPSYGMPGLDNTECPGGPFAFPGNDFESGCTSTTGSQAKQRHMYDA